MIKVIEGLYTDKDDKTKHKIINIEQLETINNYFELVENKPNRIFIDIDGKLSDMFIEKIKELSIKNKETIKQTFKNYTNENILNKLKQLEDVSIMSSSSITYKKLSYRITFINEYTDDLKTMKKAVINEKYDIIKEILKPFILILGDEDKKDNQLNIDLSVYREGKMRCVNAYKTPKEQTRINKLKKGNIIDTIIGYIPKDAIKRTFEKENVPEESIEEEKYEEETFEQKYERIEKLLSLLNDNRAEEYDDWLKISFIIYNELGKQGFPLFNEFSKRCPKKYKENECKKHYLSIKEKENKLTLATLIMFAKEDNLEEYNKTFPKKEKNDLKQLINCFNHANVAEYYINHFEEKDDYKYIYDSKLWFSYYDNNILSEEGNTQPPTQLFNDIKNKITNHLEQELNKLGFEILTLKMKVDEMSNKKLSNKEELELEKIEREISKKEEEFQEIKKLIKTIGTSSFIKGTIDFIKNYYLVDKLQDKINNNINILAFNDKVFDFTIKDFRPIKKSDFITFTTKYNAPINSKPEIRNELDNLLLSVFNTEKMKNYWLQTVSMAIFTTKYESVYIHTGSGGNGKGLLFNLLSHCLGDYYKQANNEFLTTKFKADAPNSELANAKGKRFFVVSEPSAGDGNNKQVESKLNVDFIKFLSGNDKIACRDLYIKAKSEYKAQFTLFMQCNLKPKLSKNDKGIFRRLKIIDYPNEFVENPIKPNQKKININLKTKLENQNYINEFMLMLLETAKKEIIEEPEEIKQAVEEYKEENDPVKGWLLENFEITNEDLPLKQRMRTSELYNEFPEKQNLTASSFKQYLIMNEVKVKMTQGINLVYNLKRIEKDLIDDLDK